METKNLHPNSRCQREYFFKSGDIRNQNTSVIYVNARRGTGPEGLDQDLGAQALHDDSLLTQIYEIQKAI